MSQRSASLALALATQAGSWLLLFRCPLNARDNRAKDQSAFVHTIGVEQTGHVLAIRGVVAAAPCPNKHRLSAREVRPGLLCRWPAFGHPRARHNIVLVRPLRGYIARKVL